MNKIDKPLANVTKMRKEKTQNNDIRKENGAITTNTKEIQGSSRDNFENLFSNKLENLQQMDNFIDAYEYPKFNQEEINH
jgi:hypothetical protein